MRIPGKFSSMWFLEIGPQNKNTATLILLFNHCRKEKKKTSPLHWEALSFHKRGSKQSSLYLRVSSESPHSAIISLVKGTFNDMIGKKHILTAVKAKLIPGNIWGNEPNGHLQWFNRQDSLEHFNRCTPGKNGVPWKHLYFSFSFPVVSIYSSVRDHIQYLIFRTLAWTLPTTAVLDKISKQLVLEGRKKGWIKSSWAKLSYSTGLCPCPDNATISCWTCSKWVKYMAPTTDEIYFSTDKIIIFLNIKSGIYIFLFSSLPNIS